MGKVALSIPIGVSILAVLLPQMPINTLSYHPGKFFINNLEAILNATAPPTLSIVVIQIVQLITNMYVWNVAYGVGTVMAMKLVAGSVSLTTTVHLFWWQVK